MQDDDQCGGFNENLIGGIEDIDNSMMETMFNLSAYASVSSNTEDNDVECDDHDSSSQELGVRNDCQNAAIKAGHISLDPTDQKFSFPLMASTAVCLTGLTRKFLLCF
jgi:hypothetical protein